MRTISRFLVSNPTILSTLLAVLSLVLATPVMASQQDPPPRMVGSLDINSLTSASLQVVTTAEFEKPASKIFDYLADSRRLAEWLPPVQAVRVEGDGRIGSSRFLTLVEGGEVTERIVAYDESTGVFAYTIGPENPFDLGNHLGVLEIVRAGRGSKLVWRQYFQHSASDQVGRNMAELMGQAVVGLTERFGGAVTGGAVGQSMVQLTLTREVAVAADRVWEVVGEGYGDVAEWSSVITHAELQKVGTEWMGAQRTCNTSLGGFKETVVRFDEERRELAYRVDEGLPPVVVEGVNSWRIEPTGRKASRIHMTLQLEMIPNVPPSAAGGMKEGMRQVLEITLDDLDHFLRYGQPHPRKPQNAAGR